MVPFASITAAHAVGRFNRPLISNGTLALRRVAYTATVPQPAFRSGLPYREAPVLRSAHGVPSGSPGSNRVLRYRPPAAAVHVAAAQPGLVER